MSNALDVLPELTVEVGMLGVLLVQPGLPLQQVETATKLFALRASTLTSQAVLLVQVLRFARKLPVLVLSIGSVHNVHLAELQL